MRHFNYSFLTTPYIGYQIVYMLHFTKILIVLIGFVAFCDGTLKAAEEPSPEASARPGQIRRTYPPGGAETELKAIPAQNREAGTHGQRDMGAGSQISIGVQIPLGGKAKDTSEPQNNPSPEPKAQKPRK